MTNNRRVSSKEETPFCLFVFFWWDELFVRTVFIKSLNKVVQLYSSGQKFLQFFFGTKHDLSDHSCEDDGEISSHTRWPKFPLEWKIWKCSDFLWKWILVGTPLRPRHDESFFVPTRPKWKKVIATIFDLNCKRKTWWSLWGGGGTVILNIREAVALMVDGVAVYHKKAHHAQKELFFQLWTSCMNKHW